MSSKPPRLPVLPNRPIEKLMSEHAAIAVMEAAWREIVRRDPTLSNALVVRSEKAWKLCGYRTDKPSC